MLRIDQHTLTRDSVLRCHKACLTRNETHGDTPQANMSEKKCIGDMYSEEDKRAVKRKGRKEG